MADALALDTEERAALIAVARGVERPGNDGAASGRPAPAALLTRLDRASGHVPLRLLSGGARDVPKRQQTVRDTIDWSYHLLDPSARQLFSRLGVFVGGCALDAIDAICNLDGALDVLDSVTSLAAPAIRAEALRGATALAIEQGDLPHAFVRRQEGLALYREIDEARGAADMLNMLGNIAREQGASERATACYEESLALRRQSADSRGVAYTLTNLGDVARDQGELPRAAALYEESLALQRDLGDRQSHVRTLVALGDVACACGDVARGGMVYGGIDVEQSAGRSVADGVRTGGPGRRGAYSGARDTGRSLVADGRRFAGAGRVGPTPSRALRLRSHRRGGACGAGRCAIRGRLGGRGRRSDQSRLSPRLLGQYRGGISV